MMVPKEINMIVYSVMYGSMGRCSIEMLLEKGLARYAYVYDPPYTHSKEYMKAQNRAKDKKKEFGVSMAM